MGYKSLICPIEGFSGEIDRALKEIEDFSNLEGLDKDKCARLRLIGEEIIGMAEGLFEITNGRFWIEKEGNDYFVKFACKTEVGDRAKAILNDASKNKEYKGIVGLVRKVFDEVQNMVEISSSASGGVTVEEALNGMIYQDETSYEWSLRKYEESCERDEKANNWDELELSVIKKMSKDIIISFRNDRFDIEVLADI